MTIRVLLADDQSLFRETLERSLETEPDLEVVGEAADFREAVSQARSLEPDLVLLDVGMPGRGVIDGIADLRAVSADIKILILSAQPEDTHAVRCLRAGALGFVRKTTRLDDLLRAIRRAAGGRRVISADLADKLLDLPEQGEPHESLSNREHQTALMIASGSSVSDIAEELCLSTKTVSTYRKRVLEKLSLQNNQELTAYLIRSGLLDLS